MFGKANILARLVMVTALMMLFSAGLVLAGGDIPEERKIRTLELACLPQGTDLSEYRASELYAPELRKLGLDVKVHPMTYPAIMDHVYRDRTKFDMCNWYFGAKPIRFDPDALLYPCFHSSTAKKGYNMWGYKNPEMDEILKAQRVEVDPQKRQKLIWKVQQIVAEECPIIPTVHRSESFVFNKRIWDPDSIVDQAAVGIRNYWTMVRATPLTENREMVLNYGEAIRIISPLSEGGISDQWVSELIFDRLMRIGPDGLPKPSAAKEVKWLDNVTLEVTLRDGMKFHDGKPVSAADVIFTIEAIESGEAAAYQPYIASIKSVEALSSNKLLFHLKNPNAAFLVTCLSKICITPKHIWEPIIEDLKKKEKEDVMMYQVEMPIGSGPFRFVRWKRDEEVVLDAVKDHYHAPKMNKAIFRKVSIPEVVLGQIVNEELNFLSDYRGDPTVLKRKVEATDYLEMKTSITLSVRFFFVNMRRPPFDDKAFRKALAYVAPRNKIIQIAEYGATTRADSLMSEKLEFWHNPNLPQYEYNVDKAKQVLAEAGYEWNKDGKLCYPKGRTETLKPAY
jgi:peptide/nickel transport system substrate-binding protein